MFCDTFLLVVDTGNNITNHTIRGQAFAWPLICDTDEYDDGYDRMRTGQAHRWQ